MKTCTKIPESVNAITPVSVRKLATRGVIALATTAALAACGGNSGNSTATNNESIVSEDTDQIIRNAAANIAAPLQRNISGIAKMTDTVTTSPAIGQMLKGLDSDSRGSDSERSIAAATDTDNTADLDIEDLLMMIVDSENGATTSRNGNTITIDPDDTNVCREITSEPEDADLCARFMAGFDVKISAISDHAGSATLQYDQQPVVTMNYTPDSSSIALQLQGIHSVMQQLILLENDGGTLPEVMHGALTISSSVEGTESEQVFGSIAVTQAIEIIDSAENMSLTLNPSTLVAMESGESTEKLSFNIDGLRFSELVENEDASSTAQAVVSVPGFTANIEVQTDDSIKVTQLGFGKGPFKVTIDNAEMINMALAQFGFTVDGNQELITLSNALDFNLMLDNIGGYLDDEMSTTFNARISASAAAGTALLEQSNESVKVSSGGPINFDYQINDGSSNPTGSFTANAGECFDLIEDDEATEALMEIVACE